MLTFYLKSQQSLENVRRQLKVSQIFTIAVLEAFLTGSRLASTLLVVPKYPVDHFGLNTKREAKDESNSFVNFFFFVNCYQI